MKFYIYILLLYIMNRKSKKIKETKRSRDTKKSRKTGGTLFKNIFNKSSTDSNKSFEKQRQDAMPQQKIDYKKCMKDYRGKTTLICSQFENILDDYFKCIEEYKKLNKLLKKSEEEIVESKEKIFMYEKREEFYHSIFFEIMNDPKYSKKLKESEEKNFDKEDLKERIFKFTNDFNSSDDSHK